MPPKKRGTRTRTALQAKHPVKEEGLASTKRDETTPDEQPREAKKSGTVSPVLPVKRLRVRTATASESDKQSSSKASKAKQSSTKAKKVVTKVKKMASRGTGRKRTQKVANTAAGTYSSL